MFANYNDIRSRLGTPLWFDEYAVPRYCEFHPNALADIYTDEAALFSVACQVCNLEFIVAASAHHPVIEQSIRGRELSFGDPPNTGCSNAHMSSMPGRVLQYWRRKDYTIGWERDMTLEGDIKPQWVIEGKPDEASPYPPNSECPGSERDACL